MDRISSIVKENRVPLEKTVVVLKGSDVSTQVKHYLSLGVPEADIARGLNISIHNVQLMALDAKYAKVPPKTLQPTSLNTRPTSPTISKVQVKAKGIGR